MTTALRDVVELACLAPSVHNTQPWAWRIVGSTLELYADRSRLLPGTDPVGHNLVISCGAALHHAQVAALGLGWQPSVDRMPDGSTSDLLARIELIPARRTPDHLTALEALRARRTDRRRMTSWPVPEGRLLQLAALAERWGVIATPLTDDVRRCRVDELLDRAFEMQAADPRLAGEQSGWVDHSDDDGVPAGAVPDRSSSTGGRASRFGVGRLEDADCEVESTDGLIVLGSTTDDVGAWLRAGEALSSLWLAASVDGLSVVPLSQPIEVAETRAALQRDVLVSLAVPHVLVRIGWPSISRTALPPVPRRAVRDVMRA